MVKPSRAAAATFIAVLLFLWAPLAVLVAYSFNDSRFSAVWAGFTLDWYRRLATSAETAAALRNTLIISISSTVVATALGTALAIGIHNCSHRLRSAIDLLLYMPIIVPDIIIGVATLALYVAVQMPLGHVSVILAHVAFQISFVALVVRTRLHGFPPSLLEAARDLGATHWQTLRWVVLPLLRPAIAAAGLIAFALSVADFVITYFTAGSGASTLPVRIYSMVKRGVTPDINALSTLMLLVTLAVLAAGMRLQRNTETHS